MLTAVEDNILTKIKTEVLWYDYEFTIPKKIHEEAIRQVNKFGEEMQGKNQSANYYKKNRNAKTPVHDIKFGKYGEYAVAYFLYRQGFPICIPDVSIREGADKGWDCDLPYASKDHNYPNCHVKTCDQKGSEFVKRVRGERYSWTFQYNNASGNGGRDSLFFDLQNSEIIVFAFVSSVENNKVHIVASGPWNKVNVLLKDPIAYKLKGLKKCIYASDLFNLADRKVTEI